MELLQLSEATQFLTPEQTDAYMRFIMSAHPIDLPHSKALFKQLAPDHEIQLLTDDIQSYPIGIGEEAKVRMDKREHERMWELSVELNSGRQLYLIHNHPASELTYDSLPSPSDISFWATLPSNISPAIYFNSTNTILTFSQPSPEDIAVLRSIH